jgi:MATE family multidrug resistance protein
MLTLGIGIATAVRVATAVGAHDREGAARAGWVGTGLVVLLMLLLAVATRLGHDTIARLYTIEPEVLPLAMAGLGIAAWMMVADGIQGVLIGALRGLADAIVPTVVYGLSFWILGIPLAWWFGLRAGLGVPGLLWSMTLGLVVAALLLAWRFHALTRSAAPPARPFSAG